MPRRRDGGRAPNGGASIYRGKDGWWHGRVTMGVRDDGTSDRRHVMGETEAEVLGKVRQLERDRDAGRKRRPGRAMTVEGWLSHWLENIAAASVRPKTYAGYSSAVRRHLIPGLGAHRIDRLQPEHIERLYAKLRATGLASGTVHHVHRTLRAALNEAVRRGRLASNPATIARAPRVEEEEIEPFTVDEARRVLTAATERRNGVRYMLALTVGLRQGEALGLQWRDVDLDRGTLTIRRALQRQTWRHGCEGTCGRKRGADCPTRHAGGLVTVDTKSRAGRRTMGIPAPLLIVLRQHREDQAAERDLAADLWQEGGWVFTQPTGQPLDPRGDLRDWHTLLDEAEVRTARLHDARHTAATMLLVLKVPTRAVMDVMGWSNVSMASRYQHVPLELLLGIAQDVGGLLWKAPDHQADGDDDDGLAGAPVPA